METKVFDVLVRDLGRVTNRRKSLVQVGAALLGLGMSRNVLAKKHRHRHKRNKGKGGSGPTTGGYCQWTCRGTTQFTCETRNQISPGVYYCLFPGDQPPGPGCTSFDGKLGDGPCDQCPAPCTVL
jgi:hypothetical protein